MSLNDPSFNLSSYKPINQPDISAINEPKTEKKSPPSPEKSNLELSAALIKTIESIPNHQERVQAFKNVAGQVLNQENPDVKTTIQQFSFLHCTSILKDSQLEGAPSGQYSYWTNLLEKWESKQASIADPKLTKEQIAAAKKDIQECAEFDELFKKGNSEGILKLIKQKLDKNGECTIPLGWSGTPGHFMLGKLRLEGNQISLVPMTKGGGAEYHQPVNIGSNKVLISYKGEPIYFSPNRLFNTKIGKSFIKRLCKLQTKNNSQGKEYDAADLYGLFMLMGKRTPLEATKYQETKTVGVTPQRSGTCTDTGLRMPFYEAILLDPEADSNDIKRAMYAVKFQSLVDGFRQFKGDIQKDEETQIFLEHAARNHLTRLLKLYPEILSDEEFLLGYTIGNEILSKVEEAKSVIQNSPSPQIPEFHVPKQVNPFQQKSSLPIPAFDPSTSSSEKANSLILQNPPIFSPAQISKQVEDFYHKTAKMYGENHSESAIKDLFLQIHQFFSALPITSGESKDVFWDKVPTTDLSKCLENLTKLVALSQGAAGAERNKIGYDTGRAFEISARAYDIACQIAPRIPELKLIKGYGFSWAEMPDDVKAIDQQAFFRYPSTLEAIKKIDANFKKRNKQNKNLFPRDVSTQYKDESHLVYLSQFIDPKKRAEIAQKIKNEGRVSSLKDKIYWNEEDYMVVDPEKNLYPPQFYYLQALAIAAHPFKNESRGHYLVAKDGKPSAGYRKFYLEHPTLFHTSRGNPLYNREINPKLNTNMYGRNLARQKEPYTDKYDQKKTYTENAIYIKEHHLSDDEKLFVNNFQPDKLPLPPVHMEELALLSCEREVQITETLNWAIDNAHLLNNPIAQGHIEDCIFTYDLLEKSLRVAFAPTVNRIHRFITNGFNRYAVENGDLQTTLWLTRMGVYLENYIQSISNKKISKPFPDYETILKNLLNKATNLEERSLILQHLILCFTNKKEMGKQDYIDLLTYKFQLGITGRYVSKDYPELLEDSCQAYFMHHSAVRDYMAQLPDKDRHEFINKIVSKALNIEEIDVPKWEKVNGEKLVFKSDRACKKEYLIDFDIFEIREDGDPIREINLEIMNSSAYREVLGNKPLLYQKKNGMLFILPDKKIKLLQTGSVSGMFGSTRIQKIHVVEGQEKWYEYVPYGEVYNLCGTSFPKPLLEKNYICWMATNDAGKLDRLYFVDRATGKFAYGYSPKTGLAVADPETGSLTNKKVFDISQDWLLTTGNEITKSQPSFMHWITFIHGSDFEDLSQSIVIQETTDDKGEIKNIKFPRLDLSFTHVMIEGKEWLQCDQYPEYVLAPTQDKKMLKNIKGALLLQTPDGKSHKVIIAAKEIHQEKRLGKNVSVNHENPLSTGGNPYFTYDIGPDKKTWQPESPRAALYLSLRLRAQKDYQEALEYLQKAHKLEKDDTIDLEMINKILIPYDHSPLGCAFDCQLAIRLFEHQRKYDKSNIKSETSLEEQKTYKEIKEHLKEQYATYRTHLSDRKEGISSVPAYLRLQPEQEVRLGLTYFIDPNKKLIDEDFAFFDNVLGTFSNNSAEARRLSDKICQGEKKNSTLINSDSIRVSEKIGFEENEYSTANGFVMDHFFSLFNQARSLQGEDREIFKMDLFFLSKHDKEINSRFKFAMQILAYAWQYPKLFEYLNPLPKSSTEGEKIFKDILDIINKAQSQYPYSNIFIQKTRDASSSLPIRRQTIQQAASAAPQQPLSFSPKLNQETATAASYPLQAIAKEYIAEKNTQPADIGAFVFEGRDLSKDTPLDKKQIESLRVGYEILTETAKEISYTLKSDISDQAIRDRLDSLQKQDEAKAKQLTAEIEALANITISEKQLQLDHAQLLDFLTHQSKQKSGQVKIHKIEDLIALFLQQDTQALLKNNPALDSKDVQEIHDKILELFIINSRVNQLDEAINLADKVIRSSEVDKNGLRQLLAGVLDRKRAYNPEEFPLFAIYEYASGLMLRPDQVELVRWIFNAVDQNDYQSLLFQFAAGGGKTKVIQPILAIDLARRGFLPVSMNIESLYEIGKGDLEKSLLAAFKQLSEVLEIDLSTKDIKTEIYQNLYEDLMRFHSDKKCLIMKTETFAALQLKYQQALENKEEDKVDVLYKILSFLAQNGVSLIDEGHQSLDPLHEFNTAVGKPFSMPVRQQKLIVDIMMRLAGLKGDVKINTKDGEKSIKEALRLTENHQALTSEEDMQKIRLALIPDLLSDSIFKDITDNSTLLAKFPEKGAAGIIKEIEDYLLDPSSERPEWMEVLHNSTKQEDRDIASMISLAKKFLYEISPYTLRLIGSIHYGDSLYIEQGDLTCAPRHNKQQLKSKFQEVFVTMALTSQNILQKGLDGQKLSHLFQMLLREHEKQKKALGTQGKITKAQALFNQWWADNDNPLSIDHIFLNNPVQMEQIAQKIGKKNEVIESYLLKCALPQIVAYPEKITCTPPNILRGFKKNIVFTATPGLIELYPTAMQDKYPEDPMKPKPYKLDLAFEASVVQTANQNYNHKIQTVDFSELNTLFQSLYDEDPNIIKNLCAIIDLGGTMRAFENPQVIEAFLNFTKENRIPFTGGIYRKETTGEQKSETGQLIYVQKEEEGGLSTNLLKGSNLRVALKQLGQNFDEVMLLTFFDRAITTGADILQPLGRKGLLTVGEDSTKTNAIQAAMRLRQLLKGDKGQTLTWLIQKELEAQIPKGQDKLSIEDLFIWMIHNESLLMEKAIVMRAYQGIQDLMRNVAWKEINDPMNNPDERIAIYHKYRNGLVDHVEYDPYLTFGKKVTEADARIVLETFANNCAKKLGLEGKAVDSLSEEEKKAYELIIKQTEDLVKKIKTGEANIAQHQHQETKQEVKQEVRQEQRVEVNMVAQFGSDEPAIENYDPKIYDIFNYKFLTKTYLSNPANQHTNLKDYLKLSLIPDDMIISSQYFRLTNDPSDLYLKPIPFYLIVQEGKNPPIYKPVSRKEASLYKQQLASDQTVRGRKILLVDREGKVDQNGKGAMGFSKDEIRSMKDNIRKHAVIGAFLSGQVLDFELLKTIAKENWTSEQYQEALEVIRKVHVGRNEIDWSSLQEIREFKKEGMASTDSIAQPAGTDESLSGHIPIHTLIANWIRYFFPVRKVEEQQANAEVQPDAQAGSGSWIWSIGATLGSYNPFSSWKQAETTPPPKEIQKDVKVLNDEKKG